MGGSVGQYAKGEIPLSASPGSGTEQGMGCGGGLRQVRPLFHGIALGIHPGKT